MLWQKCLFTLLNKSYYQLPLNPMDKIQKWLHDFYLTRWGFPDKKIEDDSFQPVYRCKFCNGRLAQDSTSAWFHL